VYSAREGEVVRAGLRDGAASVRPGLHRACEYVLSPRPDDGLMALTADRALKLLWPRSGLV